MTVRTHTVVQFLRWKGNPNDGTSISFAYDELVSDSDVSVVLWNDHMDEERYLYNIDLSNIGTTINLVNKKPITVTRPAARQIWKKLIDNGWYKS